LISNAPFSSVVAALGVPFRKIETNAAGLLSGIYLPGNNAGGKFGIRAHGWITVPPVLSKAM
jgi:hypothetical protein